MHPPLLEFPDSVRLLRLFPGSPDEAICCVTFSVRLSDKPQFSALSYTWGPMTPTQEVQLNGSPFTIRQNLRDCLCTIRSTTEQKLLWCDQLCIDQGNDKEKNHQVQIMGEIYKSAGKVAVWLGYVNEEMAGLATFLSRVSKIYEELIWETKSLNLEGMDLKLESVDRFETLLSERELVSAKELQQIADSVKLGPQHRKEMAMILRQAQPNAIFDLA